MAAPATDVGTVNVSNEDPDDDAEPLRWISLVLIGLVAAFLAVLLLSWFVTPNLFGGWTGAFLWLFALSVTFGALVPIRTAIRALNIDE